MAFLGSVAVLLSQELLMLQSNNVYFSRILRNFGLGIKGSNASHKQKTPLMPTNHATRFSHQVDWRLYIIFSRVFPLDSGIKFLFPSEINIRDIYHHYLTNHLSNAYSPLHFFYNLFLQLLAISLFH